MKKTRNKLSMTESLKVIDILRSMEDDLGAAKYTFETLAAHVKSQVDFEVTPSNIKGVLELIQIKLVEPPPPPKPPKPPKKKAVEVSQDTSTSQSAPTAVVLTSELDSVKATLQELIGKVEHLTEVNQSLDRKIKAQQELIDAQADMIGRLQTTKPAAVPMSPTTPSKALENEQKIKELSAQLAKLEARVRTIEQHPKLFKKPLRGGVGQ